MEDVLRTIFEYGYGKPKFAETVSKVCTVWRTVAFDCPLLWTTIIVPNKLNIVTDYQAGSLTLANLTSTAALFSSDATTAGLSFTLLQVFLKNSAGHSIDLEIYIEAPPTVDEQYYQKYYLLFHVRTQLIAKLINPHLSRLRSFCVHTNTMQGTHHFFDALGALPRPFPRLKHFSVKWHGGERGLECILPRNLYVLSMFNGFSGLFEGIRSIAIHTTPELPPMGAPIANQPVPVSQPSLFGTSLFCSLSHLHLSGISVDWSHFVPSDLETLNISKIHSACLVPLRELRRILVNNSATLRTLRLCDVTSASDFGFGVEPFTLPNVTTASIGFHTDAKELFLLVSHMFLPGVRDLAVEHSAGPARISRDEVAGGSAYHNHMNHLFSLLTTQYSFARLKRLELVNLEFMAVDTPLLRPAQYYLESRRRALGECRGLCHQPANASREVRLLGETWDRHWYDEMMRMIHFTGQPFHWLGHLHDLEELVLIRSDQALLTAVNIPWPSRYIPSNPNRNEAEPLEFASPMKNLCRVFLWAERLGQVKSFCRAWAEVDSLIPGLSPRLKDVVYVDNDRTV